MNRRQFTEKAIMASVVSAASPFQKLSDRILPSGRSIKKGIMWSSIGIGKTISEKFHFAKEAGFEGVEVMSHLDRNEVINARNATGLVIPSICGSLHGKFPLSDPDSRIREQGLEALKVTLEDAKAYGADTALLVVGRVTESVSYDDCWKRTVEEIKKIIPLAEQLNVIIAIENVSNNFILSPLEAAYYVDQFKSPYLKFYFDCGNILAYGWPEQWIRILGERIARVHIKEFSIKIADKQGRRAGYRVKLQEGDVNWPAVMEALDDIGYTEWATVEQSGGDTKEGLNDLCTRLQNILAS